jgi:hypothetical protein
VLKVWGIKPVKLKTIAVKDNVILKGNVSIFIKPNIFIIKGRPTAIAKVINNGINIKGLNMV